MYNYNVWQWFLFFYIYCLIGWIWETSYVSIKNKKFENRGFMNGPFLPIYGSGAMTILFVALPVRTIPVLVFFFGMIAATILELFTGILMEKLFHMRYWDYSYRKIQYKGHICLISSLAWGVFSCLMIYGFHKPIESLVLMMPEVGGQILTMTLTIIFVSDFSTSFKTAMELRHMLISVDTIKQYIDKAEKAAETMKDEAEEELHKLLSESTEKLEHLSRAFLDNKAIKNLIKRNPNTVSKKHAETFTEYRDEFLKSFKEKMNNTKCK